MTDVTPTPDFVLLDKVYEQIAHLEAQRHLLEPDERGDLWSWEQGRWRSVTLYKGSASPACSTAMCFAGWTAQIDGVEWAEDSDGIVLEPTGRGEHVSTWARDRLGLTPPEASLLFAGDNKLRTIKKIIDHLKVKHGAL